MNTDTLLQQLLALPTVIAAIISPDGRWIAFVWYRIHPSRDVFVAPTDGSSAPIALTHTPEAAELVSWTADSRAVIVSEDHSGDERNRLFRIDLDRPGVMQALTEDRPSYFIRGGDLHPNNQVLFYGMNYDVATGQTIEATWLYRHDLRTGERIPLVRPLRPTWHGPELNRAGTHLIYTRQDRHPAGTQIYLVAQDGSAGREILNFGDDVKIEAHWLSDSEQILVIADAHDGQAQNHKSRGIYHWPSGALRWLIDDPERQIETATVAPDGLVIVDEVRDGQHLVSWLDPASGAETAFPRLPGNLLSLGRAPDGAWIAFYYAATWPAELVRFTAEARSPADLVLLTRVWERTSLTSQQMTPAEDFRWTSVDGLEIQGWLYRAQPNPNRAVIHIHGGPTAHSEDRLNPQIQYFVAQGFNVLDVNYRGSTGFGLRFREAIKEDGWGGREQADIATGAEALIQAGLAAPGRVGVTGTSYGGYSSWCQITRYPPELIAAAAPICGMTDLVIDYHTTRPDLRPYSEEMIGGTPEQIPERYRERSPIHFVQNIRGRLLIVQGAQDPNVTPENVRQVITYLDNHNIPYELLVFYDEGHGVKKPANQEQLFTRLALFFDAALGSDH
jgi:dipeptidyl aminopeptidase/acylaminoacyl peptidase